MAETVTLEQVEELAAQLPPMGQLKLLAHISQRLSTLNLLAHDADDEAAQRARAARAEAILALCDTAAAAFEGESDAAEEIRRMRAERVEQICQNAA